MMKASPLKTVVSLVCLIAVVVILSMISVRIWGGKPETLPELGQLKINGEMTVGEFGRANGLPNPTLKGIFGLQTRSDLERRLLSSYGTPDQVRSPGQEEDGPGSGTWIQELGQDPDQIHPVVHLPDHTLHHVQRAQGPSGAP